MATEPTTEIRSPETLEELEDLRDKVMQLSMTERCAWMDGSSDWHPILAQVEATVSQAQRVSGMTQAGHSLGGKSHGNRREQGRAEAQGERPTVTQPCG